MTDPEENQGSQNREDVDYWVNKYLQNKSLGLLDEAKENPKKKEEVEYWMIRFLEKKRRGWVDNLYEHVTRLNSGKIDLPIYDKETLDIQAQIKDIDVKIGLLREEAGSKKKEEGVEYWILKHQEEKKDGIVQALYSLTAEFISGKLDKQEYTQKAAEIEQQLKAASTKISMLRTRMATGESAGEKQEPEQETIMPEVTAKPVLIKQAAVEKKEKLQEPQKEERTAITLGYETFNEDVSVTRVLKYTIAIFIIGGVLLHFYLNSYCLSAPVTMKAPDILALLGLIKDKSPGDYEMLCKYSKGIDYLGEATPESHGDNIIISNAYLGYSENGDKTENDDRILAGYVIHEACHNMMYQVMGGYGKNRENDVERPCERMRYMFMYRVGYYASYMDMVNALAKEEYGKKPLNPTTGISSAFRQLKEDPIYRYGSLGQYCEKTRLGTEKTIESPQGYYVTFKNAGQTDINCGTIEFLVNGVEYPLNCFDLSPGQTYRTGEDFKLKNLDVYSAGIAGC